MIERPHVVSTRLAADERRLLAAVATARGLAPATVIREAIITGAREQLRRLAEYSPPSAGGLPAVLPTREFPR